MSVTEQKLAATRERNPVIHIGDYMLWGFDDTRFGITHKVTGESAVFEKEDFLPYVSSFFGLNF
jgi:hypothetical protein